MKATSTKIVESKWKIVLGPRSYIPQSWRECVSYDFAKLVAKYLEYRKMDCLAAFKQKKEFATAEGILAVCLRMLTAPLVYEIAKRTGAEVKGVQQGISDIES